MSEKKRGDEHDALARGAFGPWRKAGSLSRLGAGLPLGLLYLATWLLLGLDQPHRLLSLALAAPLVWLSLGDLARHQIPDAATAVFALLAALWLTLAQPDDLKELIDRMLA